MKIVLEFDGIEERTEALEAINASDYILALGRIKQDVRTRWKWSEYKHEETNEEVDAIYKGICDIIAELPGEVI